MTTAFSSWTRAVRLATRISSRLSKQSGAIGRRNAGRRGCILRRKDTKTRPGSNTASGWSVWRPLLLNHDEDGAIGDVLFGDDARVTQRTDATLRAIESLGGRAGLDILVDVGLDQCQSVRRPAEITAGAAEDHRPALV